jgi:GNAT superfamily N-acetyltransferase
MTSQHVVALQFEPNPADIQTLVKGLVEFNTAQLDGETQQFLVATVRDETSSVVGGIFAVTYMGWLHVQAVWLGESLRGQGYGSALMKTAEEEARRRGCRNAFLETLSFQALPFYEKLGYTIFSTLHDMPPGGARYALTKVLQQAVAPTGTL